MDKVAAQVATIFRHGDPTSVGVACWALASYHPLGCAGPALWALAPDNFLLPETYGAFDALPVSTVSRMLRHPFPEMERVRLLRPYVQTLCDRLHRDNKNQLELWAAYGSFGKPGLPRPSLAAFESAVNSWRGGGCSGAWVRFPAWAMTWLKCTDWTDEVSCTDTRTAYEVAAGSDGDGLFSFLNTADMPCLFLLPARLLRGKMLIAAHARFVAFMDVPDYVWEDGVERIGYASYDAVVTDLFEHAGDGDASWIGLAAVLECLPELLRTKPSGIDWPRVFTRVFPDQLRDKVASAISAIYDNGDPGTPSMLAMWRMSAPRVAWMVAVFRTPSRMLGAQVHLQTKKNPKNTHF